MRFGTSQALDSIERRLATDPLRTGGIVDVAEVVRLADLDAGRPASLLRLGLLVDGLARLLGDGGAMLYPVAERGLLSDTDLTSNERMVLRRWSDDGLLEILPARTPVLPRAVEIAGFSSQPVLTRATVSGYALKPVADGGGAALLPVGPGPTTGAAAHPALSRLWRCSQPDCASFGRPGNAQSPPHLGPGGVPTCPRHGERLADAGPRPPVIMLVARVGGLVRQRFGVATGHPVVVGRSPDERGSVLLGPYLDERAVSWISRRHVVLDLRPDGLYATDTSTNGTVAVGPGGRARLTPGEARRVGEQESLELYEGVEVARVGGRAQAPQGAPRSVMAEAPTVAIQIPRGSL